MLTLTSNEAGAWCANHAVPLDDRRHPIKPEGARAFKIPVDTGQRIHMVATHLHTHIGDAETLVWFTEWSVWPSSERPHIFSRFRASYGETRPLMDVPAHVFDREEHEDLVSFVTLGVLFLWDVYVVTPQVTSLHYSHDEVGWVNA